MSDAAATDRQATNDFFNQAAAATAVLASGLAFATIVVGLIGAAAVTVATFGAATAVFGMISGVLWYAGSNPVPAGQPQSGSLHGTGGGPSGAGNDEPTGGGPVGGLGTNGDVGFPVTPEGGLQTGGSQEGDAGTPLPQGQVIVGEGDFAPQTVPLDNGGAVVINGDGTYTLFDGDGNPVQWGYVEVSGTGGGGDAGDGDGGDGSGDGGDGESDGEGDGGESEGGPQDGDPEPESEPSPEPSAADQGDTMPSDDGSGEEPAGPFGIGGRVVAVLFGSGGGESDAPTPVDTGLGEIDTAAEEASGIAALLGGRGDSGTPNGGGDTGWGDSSSGESPDQPDGVPLVPGHVAPSADESGWGDLNHPNAQPGSARQSVSGKRITAAVGVLIGLITRAART